MAFQNLFYLPFAKPVSFTLRKVNAYSLQQQVSHISKNVNSKIALLKRVSYNLTYEMKVMFNNVYIQSIIDYCCPIWSKAEKRKPY